MLPDVAPPPVPLLPPDAAPAFGPHTPVPLGGDDACAGLPHALLLVDGEVPPDPQLKLPLGTISTFGSSPRFSNRWLGRLIGLGTAGIFPKTCKPRRAELALLSLVNMFRAPIACGSKCNTNSPSAHQTVP